MRKRLIFSAGVQRSMIETWLQMRSGETQPWQRPVLAHEVPIPYWSAWVAAARTPDPRALATLNLELSSALCRRQGVGGPADFAWAWRGCESSLDPMIWPIAVSASELLTSTDLRWVRECEAHDCDRLFLDVSRTRRRRWCSMDWCGNREKSRRILRQPADG